MSLLKRYRIWQTRRIMRKYRFKERVIDAYLKVMEE